MASTSAINPRANYKAALDLAGITQGKNKGIDKTGSRYDFMGALGLGTDIDATQSYQKSKDASAMSQGRDGGLSNADTNYENINVSKNKYDQQSNLQDITKIKLGSRYAAS